MEAKVGSKTSPHELPGEACGEVLEPTLGAGELPGSLLGALGDPLAPLGEPLGRLFLRFGASWATLGAILEAFGCLSGPWVVF